MVVAEEDNNPCPSKKWSEPGNDMCHVIDNDFMTQSSYQQRNFEMCAYISLCPVYDDAIDDLLSGQVSRIHGCKMKFVAPCGKLLAHLVYRTLRRLWCA
jgi:hypothetical protein